MEREIVLPGWWWRQPNDQFTFTEYWQTAAPSTGLWKRFTENGAYRYELLRRHKPELSFKIFAEFSEREQQLISLVLMDVRGRLADPIKLGLPEPNPGPGDYFLSPPFMVRLDSSDAAISTAVREFVKKERVNLGPKWAFRRKNQRHGKRYRAVSWRRVELMDIKRLKLRPLTKSEETLVRAAKKESKKFYDKVRLSPVTRKMLLPGAGKK